ncbi:MAG: hypothetical protein HQK76_06825 [Desulfobacterales bacterium]|nr:hypothetical protein [Desulfobacterales bacterium]
MQKNKKIFILLLVLILINLNLQASPLNDLVLTIKQQQQKYIKLLYSPSERELFETNLKNTFPNYISDEQIKNFTNYLAEGKINKGVDYLISIFSTENISNTHSPAGRATEIVINDIVLPKIKREKNKKNDVGYSIIAGYLHYESVTIMDNTDGSIPGILLGFNWNTENLSLGVLIPYDILDFDTFDAQRTGVVAFGQYNRPIYDNLKLGITLNSNFITLIPNDGDGSNTFGGGISGSLLWEGRRFAPSAAISYQYNKDDSDLENNYQSLMKFGTNFGILITDNSFINVFGILSYNVSKYDIPDDMFFDVGLETSYNLTESFNLSGGYKKIVGFDDFKSDMFFLGASLKF